MKQVLGCLRRADEDFGMIAPGDHVCVGVSGGKDSLLLLHALSLYRRFSKKDFSLSAVTLTLGFEPFDAQPVAAFCRQLGVPYIVRPTRIGPIIFHDRQEKNPCSLCARMRRGILHDMALQLGCNKIALGHHREDVLETLLLSMLFEGRLHVFSPVTYLSIKKLTLIRPLLYLPEPHIQSLVKPLNLPVIPNPCPANGHTKRAEAKALLDHLCALQPQARQLMLSALQNTAQYQLWDQRSLDRAMRRDDPK